MPFNFQLIAPEISYIVKDTEMKILLTKKPVDLDQALRDLGWEQELKQFTFEEMVPPEERSLSIMPWKNRIRLQSFIHPEPRAVPREPC